MYDFIDSFMGVGGIVLFIIAVFLFIIYLVILAFLLPLFIFKIRNEIILLNNNVSRIYNILHADKK